MATAGQATRRSSLRCVLTSPPQAGPGHAAASRGLALRVCMNEARSRCCWPQPLVLSLSKDEVRTARTDVWPSEPSFVPRQAQHERAVLCDCGGEASAVPPEEPALSPPEGPCLKTLFVHRMGCAEGRSPFAGGTGVSPVFRFITPFLARKGPRGMVERAIGHRRHHGGSRGFEAKPASGSQRTLTSSMPASVRAVTMAPAITTPVAIARRPRAAGTWSAQTAKLPVHAPVRGRGMATMTTIAGKP